MARPLTVSEAERLRQIAALIEGEAQTWREGFACFRKGQWDWSTTKEKWAHVRVVKLEAARDFLTSLAARKVEHASPSDVPEESELAGVLPRSQPESGTPINPQQI